MMAKWYAAMTRQLVILVACWSVGGGLVGAVFGSLIGSVLDLFRPDPPRIFGSDRHAEIKAYLSKLERPVRFVVLDDDEIAGTDLEDHFVHVRDGLEDEHVERARRVLAEAR